MSDPDFTLIPDRDPEDVGERGGWGFGPLTAAVSYLLLPNDARLQPGLSPARPDERDVGHEYGVDDLPW